MPSNGKIYDEAGKFRRIGTKNVETRQDVRRGWRIARADENLKTLRHIAVNTSPDDPAHERRRGMLSLAWLRWRKYMHNIPED